MMPPPPPKSLLQIVRDGLGRKLPSARSHAPGPSLTPTPQKGCLARPPSIAVSALRAEVPCASRWGRVNERHLQPQRHPRQRRHRVPRHPALQTRSLARTTPAPLTPVVCRRTPPPPPPAPGSAPRFDEDGPYCSDLLASPWGPLHHIPWHGSRRGVPGIGLGRVVCKRKGAGGAAQGQGQWCIGRAVHRRRSPPSPF